MTAVADRVRAVAGRDALLTGPAERWAVRGVVPGAVVAPASADAAAAVLDLASREGWHVRIAGALSRNCAGRPTRRLDVLLSTRRLAGVLEHEPADLTASVAAGTPLAGLADALAAERQWLPLDPPSADGATLGGLVATAAAGPLRLGYGTPRDYVLGLDLVTGDGRVLRLGGRVVKNVAGYDLVRLVVGSSGRLGLVSRVQVRLRALPDSDVTVVLTGDSHGPLLETTRQLPPELLEPVALELVSPPAAIGGARSGLAWRLLARFQGNRSAVTEAVDSIRGLAPRGNDVVVSDGAEAAGIWAEQAVPELDAVLLVRFARLPRDIDETLGQALALPGAGHATILAHVGDGIVRVAVPEAGWRACEPEDWGAALGRAREALASARGSLILARAPDALVDRIDPVAPQPPRVHALAEGLEQVFDPAGVLAPDRSSEGGPAG